MATSQTPEEERGTILNHIRKEREYQELHWSRDHDLHHTPNDWIALITRRLGMAQYVMDEYGMPSRNTDLGALSLYLHRLEQAGAILVAAMEAALAQSRGERATFHEPPSQKGGSDG